MITSLHDKQEIDILRETLTNRMKRAPDWIGGASVQSVRDYKKRYKQAQKLLEKKTVTTPELTSAIQAVS